MKSSAEQLAKNLEGIRARVAAACERADRDTADVTLIAVTKYADPKWVRELIAMGMCDLGESRPQQLLERAGWSDDAIRWHLIGPLQRNKARKLLGTVELIHSVDSLKLLRTLQRLADETGIRPRALLEVNIAGEKAKHGFSPEELATVWNDVIACDSVDVAGFMAMAPYHDDPEAARPVFRSLNQLRDRLQESTPFRMTELSMGMSGDFEVAIEEGATLIRIGSALFDGLAPAT